MARWPLCHARVVVVGVVALTAVAVGIAADAAAVGAPAGFPIPGYTVRTAVAGGYIFDAASDTNDGVLHVFTGTGSQVAVIPDEPDVQALTPSADGRSLYVMLGAAQAVSVIDTTTLAEVARYDVHVVGRPFEVAEAGGRLFVGGLTGLAGFEVAVVDMTAPVPVAVDLTGVVAVIAEIAARPGSGATTDLYIGSTYLTGVGLLDHFTYTGGTSVTEQQEVPLGEVSGMAVTAAGDALLTADGNDSVAVRDPDTLEVKSRFAGAVGGSNFALAAGRVVQGGVDSATNSYRTVEVRDLSGAVTYSYRTTQRALVPIVGIDGTGLYAAELGTDYHWSVVALPGALSDPVTPQAPATVSAAAVSGGRISVSWTPSGYTGNNAPGTYRVYRSTAADQQGEAVATVTAGATTYTDTGLLDGARYYYRIATIGLTGDSAPSAQAVATADASAPSVRVTTPTRLFQVSATVTVRYTATDTNSGVASYDTRYRVAAWNQPFASYTYRPTWQHITSIAETLTGSPGHEYCLSVRARDHAGNTSGWSAERCAVVPLDDRSLTTTTAGWTRAGDSAAYLRTRTRSTTAGAQLQLTAARTDRLALVVTSCASCGKLGIYLNGKLWHTINTYSATTREQKILALPAAGLRTTTIVIKNLTSGKYALIDGLALAQT